MFNSTWYVYLTILWRCSSWNFESPRTTMADRTLWMTSWYSAIQSYLSNNHTLTLWNRYQWSCWSLYRSCPNSLYVVSTLSWPLSWLILDQERTLSLLGTFTSISIANEKRSGASVFGLLPDGYIFRFVTILHEGVVNLIKRFDFRHKNGVGMDAFSISRRRQDVGLETVMAGSNTM